MERLPFSIEDLIVDPATHANEILISPFLSNRVESIQPISFIVPSQPSAYSGYVSIHNRPFEPLLCTPPC